MKKLLVILALISLGGWLAIKIYAREQAAPRPIPSLPNDAAAFIGQPAQPQPVEVSIPPHPHLAAQGRNAMHADGFSSDVHPVVGPLGINPQVRSRIGTKMPGGQCATATFSSAGNLLALCAAISGFRIHLLAPRTLELLAEFRLPMRPSTWEALIHRDRSRIMADSSGAYFYLDQQDRVVMADSRQTVIRLAHRQGNDGQWSFFEDGRWDLSDRVPHDCLTPGNPFPDGECDPITAVMPDHDALLWWVTRHGRVGTLDTDTGGVKMVQLDGEEIQNGFSVAADGVYIVSDHAMYRFEADPDGSPVMGWREAYDRGTSRRVGSINQGSGTTPTLMGSDYVTIADNADDQINLVVYRRRQEVSGSRIVCQIPVFEPGHSATDNSMIAFNRTVILENNAGYTHSRAQTDWKNAGGGIVRVDVRADESGCDILWTSPVQSPSSVPKLAAGNGLAYFYSFHTQPEGENAWYLTALDARSGATVFQVLTGVGRAYDNNWAPITLGSDGTAYVGTARGIVAIWDGGN